jgi:hypothetical protein
MAAATDPGLVLDDSYIHLQFARTIYEGIAWQYSPGEISTGCTSPLWSVIISFLFIVTRDPTSLIWGVHVVSMLFYVASTFLVGHIAMDYTSSFSWSIIAMSGFVFLPRNTLLMLSGMETPLFVFLILLSIAVMDRHEPAYDSFTGVIVGLAFLARPEGALIAIVCIPSRILILAYEGKINRARIFSLVGMFGYIAMIASSWVLFCLHATGKMLPATFYAKTSVTDFDIQAWDIHWNIWFNQYLYLLPAIVGGILLILYKKPHPWTFAISLTIAYRLTLPYSALINHARYLVPVFDLLAFTFVLTIALLQKTISQKICKGKLSEHVAEIDGATKVVAAGVVCLVLLSSVIPQYFNMATLHAREVRNTNERQVITGLWLRENTPEDAVLAVHDAGALRFFSERRIIDMAGLVSPEFTSSNMTTGEILSYLRAEGCEYFVFFDRLFVYWSYFLRDAYTIVYKAITEDCVLPDNANMTVYHVNWTSTNF